MLNNQIIAQVQGSFEKNCIILVGRAYDNLRASGIVNHDMDENTVSENLRRLMSRDPFSINKRILVTREQPIDNGCLLPSNQSADSLPRIDFLFQRSWSIWNKVQHSFVFFMEAKNLYANDFKKTGKSSKTSAKYYHKRYVEKGIIHLLTGYYPSNSYLLGYVLEGTVTDAIKGVNVHISSVLSPLEVLIPNHTPYSTLCAYASTHDKGKIISHFMLQF